MIPVPRHGPGDIFQHSNEDLLEGSRAACVGNNGGPYDTGQLARGFFAAAQQLLRWDVPTKAINNMSIEAQDALQASIDLKVYPILYCYRHAIELALKHLLFQIPRLFQQSFMPLSLKGHKLEDWWDKLVPYLERLRRDASTLCAEKPVWHRMLEAHLCPDILANIGSIIREVHSIDVPSTTFHYALDNSGAIPLGNKQHIVLDKVYHFMLPLNVWFNTIIQFSDDRAGPTPGLEPDWLYMLEPSRSSSDGEDSSSS